MPIVESESAQMIGMSYKKKEEGKVLDHVSTKFYVATEVWHILFYFFNIIFSPVFKTITDEGLFFYTGSSHNLMVGHHTQNTPPQVMSDH